jgi:hypothetical protein
MIDCPNCEHAMENVMYSLWWCPRCGTTRNNAGAVVSTPKIVQVAREMCDESRDFDEHDDPGAMCLERCERALRECLPKKEAMTQPKNEDPIQYRRVWYVDGRSGREKIGIHILVKTKDDAMAVALRLYPDLEFVQCYHLADVIDPEHNRELLED